MLYKLIDAGSLVGAPPVGSRLISKPRELTGYGVKSDARDHGCGLLPVDAFTANDP